MAVSRYEDSRLHQGAGDGIQVCSAPTRAGQRNAISAVLREIRAFDKKRNNRQRHDPLDQKRLKKSFFFPESPCCVAFFYLIGRPPEVGVAFLHSIRCVTPTVWLMNHLPMGIHSHLHLSRISVRLFFSGAYVPCSSAFILFLIQLRKLLKKILYLYRSFI